MKTNIFFLLLITVSYNLLAQWEPIIQGLPFSGNISTHCLSFSDQYVFIGTHNGVFRSSNQGELWEAVNLDLPNQIAWELYFFQDTLYVGFYGYGAYQSVDYGGSWIPIIIGSPSSAVRGFLKINDTLKLAATWGNGVFKSTPATGWVKLSNNGLDDNYFWDLLVVEDTLLAASLGGLYRSTNKGETWSLSNNGLTNTQCYRLAKADNVIFLTTNGGVFKSIDYGNSWTITGPISGTVYAIDVKDSLILIGGIVSNVFYSSDYGNSWYNVNNANLVGQISDLGHDNFYFYATSISGKVYRTLLSNITSVNDFNHPMIVDFKLYDNFPNPFNPTTKISWRSPVSSQQSLKVYDVLGNEVATLVDEYREAGYYEVEFDGRNLASGLYFYKLQAGSFVETKKMVLIK